ncbi:MAG: LLM class flavin-dependent oxidoreductase [Chloroflexi bacterium]|nr:LLM class flavin-dependent oxidoreductase [Chloroflexota bacterium]
MITNFDSLFAGHVDVDNVGYAGTPVNDRSFSDEYLATAFDKSLAIAQLMDRTGYDTFWLAEHHFQLEGYECIPNILMLSVHLSHLTERINFGCGFNITPMWHPLRLAEDYATADIFTKGRVRFGVGRGYHTREVETLGAPLLDQSANRDLFEEQVEIVFKALKGRPFSHHGKHYDLPPQVPYRGYELTELTLVPRPLYRPFECWQPIQIATQRGLDFMVKHGIKGIIGGGVAEGGAMRKVVEAWKSAQARAGHEKALGEDLSIGFHFFLADTAEKGIKEASKYYEENIKMFGPLRLVRDLSDQQILDMADPKLAPSAGLPTMEEAVKAGAVLCGPPERIIQQLRALEEEYPGLDRVSVGQPVGTPQKVILEQLEWFSQEVMPEFTRRAPASVQVD